MDPDVRPDQEKTTDDVPRNDELQPVSNEAVGASVPPESPPDPGGQARPTAASACAPAKEGESLLKEEKIVTVGISRSKLAWLVGIATAVVTFGVGRGMSTGSKQSAGESNAQQQARSTAANAQSPRPPEGLAKLIARYPDMASPGVAAAPAQGVAVRENAAPVKSAPPGGAAGTADMNQAGEDPSRDDQSWFGQKSFVTPRDQRLKDRISATRAPVAFEGRDTRQPEPAPTRDAGAGMPSDPGGLNRILDRMAGGLGAASGEPDDQNRQSEKRGFTKENRDDFPYLKSTLLTPISKYEVKAGSIIPGVLLTGINSDLPGQITAQVRENVYDTVSGRYLLIPQGSRLIGEYDSKISYGQERVLVVWTRIIMPNGNSIGLEGMPGVDLSGYAGIGGKVNNHYGKLLTGVVLGSMIGAGAQVAVGGQGSPNVPPSFPQLFVSGAAGNINQAGQQITQKNLNLQPTIEIAPGQRINIFLTKDMILRPYTE